MNPFDFYAGKIHPAEPRFMGKPDNSEIASLHPEQRGPVGIDSHLVGADNDGIENLHIGEIAALGTPGSQDPNGIQNSQGRPDYLCHIH
jgi:hypothetical protein